VFVFLVPFWRNKRWQIGNGDDDDDMMMNRKIYVSNLMYL